MKPEIVRTIKLVNIHFIPWNTEKWTSLFFTIWSGQTLSMLGSSVAQFGLIWWITSATGSATVLAVAILLSSLPQVLIGPIAGALIDRWNRRIVMLVADGVIALASLVLAYLFWADRLEIWQVYVIMVIRATGSVFHWPANQASVSLMVPKDHLPRIAGLNQAIIGAANIICPPLGALLLQIMPLYWIMLIDVITAAFSIVPVLFIMIPQPTSPSTQNGAPVAAPADLKASISAIWGDMLVGFRYIWNWKGLFWLLVLAMLLNFFGNPPLNMVPILVTQHFRGGPLQLGWLNASFGLGLLIGGLTLGAWGGFKKRVNTMLMGVIGMGIGYLLIASAPVNGLWLAIIGFAFNAIMNAITNGCAFALYQTVVAPELQGRVFTVIMSMATAIAPISMAIGGPLADWLGIRMLYFIAGGALLVLAVAGRLSPVVYNLETQFTKKEVKNEISNC